MLKQAAREGKSSTAQTGRVGGRAEAAALKGRPSGATSQFGILFRS